MGRRVNAAVAGANGYAGMTLVHLLAPAPGCAGGPTHVSLVCRPGLFGSVSHSVTVARSLRSTKLHLSVGGLVVFERGAGANVDLSAVRRAFERPEIEIVATLGLADGRAEAWGCDLSEEYVRINADYTT